MRQNPTWLGLNKIEVYFWLLSKSRGRFFRIGIGLELSDPFNLVAPLRNSNFHSHGCLMIQSCQSSGYHNQFHPTGREKGGNIEPTLIKDASWNLHTQNFLLYPIGLHLVIEPYLSTQGIGKCMLFLVAMGPTRNQGFSYYKIRGE